MGVPKRRVSHARQGERRSHLALELPHLEAWFGRLCARTAFRKNVDIPLS